MRLSLSTLLFQVLPPALSMVLAAWKNWCVGERELRALAHIVPRQGICVDVGAHRGVYAYHLARLGRGVVAYEPNPALARYLHRAFGGKVTVRPVALGSRRGAAVLSIPVVEGASVPGRAKLVGRPAAPRNDYPATGPDSAVCEKIGATHDVVLERLDDQELNDVGFIKIDVEGSEETVLRGGEGLIRRDHPILLVEIEQRHLAKPMAEIFALIQGMGYTGYFLHRGVWMSVAQLDGTLRGDPRCTDPRSRHYVNNFLFWPRARGEAPWPAR